MTVFDPTINVSVVRVGDLGDELCAQVEVCRPGGKPFYRTAYVNRHELKAGANVIVTGCKIDASGLSFDEGIYLRVEVCTQVGHCLEMLDEKAAFAAFLVRDNQPTYNSRQKSQMVN